MGAIYGFTGAPDEKLLGSLRRSLAHRGRVDAMHDEQPAGTCGYLARADQAERQILGAGLYVDGRQAIVLAGLLTQFVDGDVLDPGPCVSATTPAHTSAPFAARTAAQSAAASRPAACVVDSRPGGRLHQLLEAYRKWGLAFVEGLRGDFVLAIHDGAEIHLARDGAGARTVYYGRHGQRWLYGSEPKAIWQAPGFSRRLRPAALAQYLTFSFVPGNGTMLEDVFELPAGHVVSLTPRGEPRLRRYFVFEDATLDEDAISRTEPVDRDQVWVERFRDELGRAVAARLPRDEPVSIFLSGGLDSSVVTAEVVRQAPQRVRTYALHFGPKYAHELEFASAVARRCGTDHEEVLIRPRDFLPQLRQMIWHLDDPIGDPITMPNYILAAHASSDSRWVFNGEGGDPCFGGPKNIPMMLNHWYGGIPRDKHFRERAYLASYRRGYEEVSRLMAPAWTSQVDSHRDLEQVIQPFFLARRPHRFLDKLASINIRLKGAHLILPKVERMMGAAGMVPLSPLFTSDMVRLSFQMPARLKLQGGIEKIVLKRAYAAQLPAEVIARPKSGMRVPVHFWFRGDLRRYARKILGPRQLRRDGILDPARVKQLLDYNIEEGAGRYGLRLWMLLTFEIWRRIVIENEMP